MSISAQPNGGVSVESRWGLEAILRIGWNHKVWFLAGLIVSIGVSGVVGVMMPRIFQSSAQISIVKKKPDAVTGIDTRALLEENMSPPQEVLRSTQIIERAIESKALGSLPMFAREKRDLTEAVRSALSVVAQRGPQPTSPIFVYKLQVRGPDPDGCHTVLTAVLDSYKEYMDKKHQSVSEDTIELILRQKKTLEKEIADHETAYRAFREKAPLLGKGKDGSELRQERLNSLQSKRTALLLQKIELQAQLTALEDALRERREPAAVLAMIVEFSRKGDSATPGGEKQLSLQDHLYPLLLEERKLLQYHGAKHPDVVEIRKRIEAARTLLLLPATAWQGVADRTENGSGKSADPVQLHVQLLKQKLNHLQISEDLLASNFQTEQDEARRLAAFEIQNDAFHTRSNMNQHLYEALVKRLNDVGLIGNVGGYQIEYIEPPSPGRQAARTVELALVLGAVLGVVLGFGLAGFAEYRCVRRASSEINNLREK